MTELFETIFLLASIQGVLLATALFFRKENHTANIYLAIVIFALSLELITSVYYSKGWYLTHIHYSGFTYPIPLSYGPLFYFYTKHLTKKQNKFSLINLSHFIPFISVYLLMFPVFFYPENEKIAFVQKMISNDQPIIYDFVEMLIPIQGLIYTYLVTSLVANYNKSIKENYSNIERINLYWLKYLALGMIVCWSIVAISYIMNLFIDLNNSFNIALHLSVSIIIYSVGYLSLSQPEIFIKPSENGNKKEKIEKYKKSGLDKESAEIIKNKLIDLMDKQKPYLDSELTLNKLAETLEVTSHHLSEVINSSIGKTYYDFVNEYRVEEFKRKLVDPSTAYYNLLSIAFDSGFKSKTSFNTIFKKYTGKTPSEYKSSITNK